MEIFQQTAEGATRIVQHPTEACVVHWSMFFNCCVGHPTVVARKSVFEQFSYTTAYLHGEDYELWLKVITQSNFKVCSKW